MIPIAENKWRFTWLALSTLLLLITAACRGQSDNTPSATSNAAPLPRDYNASIQSGGLNRTYHVHLPGSYNTGRLWPLVLVFHGGGGTGMGMNRLTNFNALADQQGFIVVYPDGYKHRWADGRGTTPPERAGVDDVAFVSALIDRLSKDLRIAPTRIYATGISNGGFFTGRLGCELSSKIAAIAVVAATMSTNLAQTCRPGRPVPFMLIHGTSDPLVPEQGGEVTTGARGSILSTSDTVARWVALNGCAARPVTAHLPQLVNDGTQVRRETYSSCRSGADVIFYTILGGGHTWPGGWQYLPAAIIGKTTRNLDATRVIWEFFQAHPRP